MPGYVLQKSYNSAMTGNKPRKKKNKKVNQAAESTGRVVSGVLDGSLITKHATEQFIPFVIYLSGLAMFLIFNTYYAEKQAREIERLGKEITELRIQYVQTKSTYMYLTNRSEMAQQLHSHGFIEPLEPPAILIDQGTKRRLWHRLLNIN